MKTFSLISLLFFSSLNLIAQSIIEAVQDKSVSATFTSSGDHYGSCIMLEIANLTNEQKKILIEPGTELIHEENKYQDHIIVDNTILVLKAKETRSIKLSALCTERFNSCPKSGSHFTLNLKTNKQRTGLAQLIAQTKQTDYAGQQAMWSLINKTTPNYIEGEDSASVMQLRHYIGKTLQLKVNPFDKRKYIHPAHVFANNLSIESKGNYYVRNINAGDTITYAIYDMTNDTVTSIKTDIAIVSPYRKHNVVWHFAAEELNPTEKYYLRIKVNGVVYKEWMYKFMG